MILAAPEARAHCGPPVPLCPPQAPKSLSFFDAFSARSAKFPRGAFGGAFGARPSGFGLLLPLALAKIARASFLSRVRRELHRISNILLHYASRCTLGARTPRESHFYLRLFYKQRLIRPLPPLGPQPVEVTRGPPGAVVAQQRYGHISASSALPLAPMQAAADVEPSKAAQAPRAPVAGVAVTLVGGLSWAAEAWLSARQEHTRRDEGAPAFLQFWPHIDTI